MTFSAPTDTALFLKVFNTWQSVVPTVPRVLIDTASGQCLSQSQYAPITANALVQSRSEVAHRNLNTVFAPHDILKNTFTEVDALALEIISGTKTLEQLTEDERPARQAYAGLMEYMNVTGRVARMRAPFLEQAIATCLSDMSQPSPITLDEAKEYLTERWASLAGLYPKFVEKLATKLHAECLKGNHIFDAQGHLPQEVINTIYTDACFQLESTGQKVPTAMASALKAAEHDFQQTHKPLFYSPRVLVDSAQLTDLVSRVSQVTYREINVAVREDALTHVDTSLVAAAEARGYQKGVQSVRRDLEGKVVLSEKDYDDLLATRDRDSLERERALGEAEGFERGFNFSSPQTYEDALLEGKRLARDEAERAALSIQSSVTEEALTLARHQGVLEERAVSREAAASFEAQIQQHRERIEEIKAAFEDEKAALATQLRQTRHVNFAHRERVSELETRLDAAQNEISRLATIQASERYMDDLENEVAGLRLTLFADAMKLAPNTTLAISSARLYVAQFLLVKFPHIFIKRMEVMI
ncbi:MAG: hypothetical protein IPJ69_04770 [Deltaproteobacteria bacterium]|nr:MAG: hypothetical protein IPJ69_04770 [Deltaproteobacteria bacterium]